MLRNVFALEILVIQTLLDIHWLSPLKKKSTGYQICRISDLTYSYIASGMYGPDSPFCPAAGHWDRAAWSSPEHFHVLPTTMDLEFVIRRNTLLIPTLTTGGLVGKKKISLFNG